VSVRYSGTAEPRSRMDVRADRGRTLDKTGKDFENLVRDLQVMMQHAYGLRPDDVDARWRYRVRGGQSTQLREVDVALFLRTGAKTMFYAIECRDRDGRQGLTWIEQLATKRQDIGADQIYAVSRDGFTKFAALSAKENGIQLFRLSDKSAFSDDKKLGDLEITTFKPEVSLRTFRWSHTGMVLSVKHRVPRLTQDDLTALSQDFDADNWYDTVTASSTSLRAILTSTLTWPDLMSGVRTDEPPVLRELGGSLDTGRYLLLRDFGQGRLIGLTSVHGVFEVRWSPEVVPASRTVQYRSVDGDILLEMHEFDGALVGAVGETAYFASIAGRSDCETG